MERAVLGGKVFSFFEYFLAEAVKVYRKNTMKTAPSVSLGSSGLFGSTALGVRGDAHCGGDVAVVAYRCTGSKGLFAVGDGFGVWAAAVFLWVGAAFLTPPAARADGAHYGAHPSGYSSSGVSFKVGTGFGGRGSYYSARPRTSIGISFYEGFGPQGAPYCYPVNRYPYYAQPVYPAPVYVQPQVVYTQPPVYAAPVYYGSPVASRGGGQTVAADEQFIRSERTAQAQEALRRLGYYKGSIDGQSGPGTRAALRTYQVDRGLAVTGRLDEETFSALGL